MESQSDPLEQIKRQYREGIPAKLAGLDALMDTLRMSRSEQALKDFHIEIHKLAGHANLYGYDQVGVVSREFSKILQDISTDQIQFPVLEHYLTKIKEAFHEEQ